MPSIKFADTEVENILITLDDESIFLGQTPTLDPLNPSSKELKIRRGASDKVTKARQKVNESLLIDNIHMFVNDTLFYIQQRHPENNSVIKILAIPLAKIKSIETSVPLDISDNDKTDKK